jgi:hypothetical protein
MSRAVLLMSLFVVACAPSGLRPRGFDPAMGIATVSFAPRADADRTRYSRGFRLVSVRDAGGTELLARSAGSARQCTTAPLELNPGRYALEVERCATSCAAKLARFSFTLDAQPGHDYRLELEKPLVSLALLHNEWEAFVIDDTTDTSRSIGKVVERCD